MKTRPNVESLDREVIRLKARGWTREDFARALARMLADEPATITTHTEGPPGAPADWGAHVCKCGHQRRQHLHGAYKCLGTEQSNSRCACKTFTPEAP